MIPILDLYVNQSHAYSITGEFHCFIPSPINVLSRIEAEDGPLLPFAMLRHIRIFENTTIAENTLKGKT